MGGYLCFHNYNTIIFWNQDKHKQKYESTFYTPHKPAFQRGFAVCSYFRKKGGNLSRFAIVLPQISHKTKKFHPTEKVLLGGILVIFGQIHKISQNILSDFCLFLLITCRSNDLTDLRTHIHAGLHHGNSYKQR